MGDQELRNRQILGSHGFFLGVHRTYIYRLHGGYDQQKQPGTFRYELRHLLELGLIFSVDWFLAVLGGKNWQENWEAHIDMLEHEITGPLYKVIHRSKYRSYSVSIINMVLSAVVALI